MEKSKKIEINGIKYTTNNINYGLQKKIYDKYGFRNGKVTEISKPGKKLTTERINLIKELTTKSAIYNMLPKTRFYKLNYITKKINNLLKWKPDDLAGKSVGDVVTSLQKRGIKVYIHGGLIRDMFLKVKSYDVDLVFDKDISEIIPICEEDGYPCGTIIENIQYINFGSDKGASVEATNLKNVVLVPFYYHEASVNDFVYDLQHNIIIDLTGFGLVDVMNKGLRLSATPENWDKWAKNDFKRPLRYFKLIQKGFNPVSKPMHKFVVNYIVDNYERLYEKEISGRYPIKRIKHFFIKTMTQGDINLDTGEYSYGPTKDKLIPYLEVLRANLPKPIFRKMIRVFTVKDMQLLKSKNIISTLQNYLSDDINMINDINSNKHAKIQNKKPSKTLKNKSIVKIKTKKL